MNITELKLSDNLYDKVKEFLAGGNKKLKKEAHLDSVFSKLIPQFFNMGSQREVYDIQIDEQRNLLYSLSFTMDQHSYAAIDIIDLGVYGDGFKKITTIQQREIIDRYLEY